MLNSFFPNKDNIIQIKFLKQCKSIEKTVQNKNPVKRTKNIH